MQLHVLAALLSLAAVLLAVPILVHAFRRSVGTGVMVLCIPGYVFVYAFTQFTHPRRHWLLPAFLGAGLASVFLGGLSAAVA